VLWAYLLAVAHAGASYGTSSGRSSTTSRAPGEPKKSKVCAKVANTDSPKTWADELSQILDSYVRADAVQRRAAAQ
jgi:hypothetical protein